MPKKTAEHYKNKLAVYINWWSKRGYEDGIPDKAIRKIESLGKVPSWRKVVKTFLKNDYWCKDWDAFAPDSEYFLELQRVSKNQVVWGANHFMEKINKGSPCWIVWDKDNSGNFADCELAFTSFKTAARLFKYTWNGMLQGDMKNKESRIHPTQKPVWLLTNYAQPGQRILDTHLGSGSHAIACNNLGFELTACELDKDYFDASVKRITQAAAQERLFA